MDPSSAADLDDLFSEKSLFRIYRLAPSFFSNSFNIIVGTCTLCSLSVFSIAHIFSGKQTFHNNNDSDNPIQIVVSLQGDDDNSFVLENGCNLGAVEPHETCEFSVHFKPVHMGFHTAAIQIAGEGWSIHSVVLRGFGIWPWDTSH